MASSETGSLSLMRSSRDSLIQYPTTSPPAYLYALASTIILNLQYQHDWTSLSIITHSKRTGQLLPRPLISGLPPLRIYIHPDEQAEILKVEHETGIRTVQQPELEWVLPTSLSEKWTLKAFADLFDAIDTLPPVGDAYGKSEEEKLEHQAGNQWQGNQRQKRVLLATLHDDSTVVYYIMHDGIVKPRQN